MHTKKFLLAAVIAVVVIVIAAVVGMIWNWYSTSGSTNGADAASDSSVGELLESKIFRPEDGGYALRIVERSPQPGLFEKSRPQWVLLAVNSGAGGSEQVTSQRLLDSAQADGWRVDEACSRDFLWCARRGAASGQTIFMTVASSERSGSDSQYRLEPGDVLLVRLQYL